MFFLFFLAHYAVGMTKYDLGLVLGFVRLCRIRIIDFMEKTKSKFEKTLLSNRTHFKGGERNCHINVCVKTHGIVNAYYNCYNILQFQISILHPNQLKYLSHPDQIAINHPNKLFIQFIIYTPNFLLYQQIYIPFKTTVSSII